MIQLLPYCVIARTVRGDNHRTPRGILAFAVAYCVSVFGSRSASQVWMTTLEKNRCARLFGLCFLRTFAIDLLQSSVYQLVLVPGGFVFRAVVPLKGFSDFSRVVGGIN